MQAKSTGTPSDRNWIAIVYLLGMPLGALLLLPLALKAHVFTTAAITYAIIHASLDCLCITVGYHRLFSHRAFEAASVMKAVILILGAGTFQNSALIWSADHRVHHREVDTDADPYSINKGFLWAHFLWMFHKDPAGLKGQFPRDLTNDKLVAWQDRYYLLLAFLSGWVLPVTIGFVVGQPFAFFYIGVILRLLVSGHSTFLINSAAHMFGTRPFSRVHTARDNWFLSILTFGEGYHNFHHKFQADYRNGIQWWAWDPSKWAIYLCSKVGLATNLRRVSDAKISAARMEVVEERLLEKGANVSNLAKLRAEWERLHEEYLAFRREMPTAREQLASMRKRLTEMKKAWRLEKRIVIRSLALMG